MQPFVWNGLPARVVFGPGTVDRLEEEAGRLEIRRALVISTPMQREQAGRAARALGPRFATVFPEAAMHTPVEITERAMALVQAEGIDGTVAIGGGSTIGLGKAVALRTDLPQIAVPTTYAGSEMTPILGETAGGRKTTQRSGRVQPETVIYDVDLTLTLPPGLSGTSGINAIAHAVEALYARDRNPVVSLMAEEGIRALGRALPRIADEPRDRDARTGALYGAWLCGACLGSVGMSLHHKLCHTLGGSFGLPHAETHTVVLPHAAACNAPTAPQAMAAVARALDCADPALGLFELAGRVGAPRGLAEIGMPEDGLARAVEIALENPYWNPKPIGRGDLQALLARAWAGDAPACRPAGEAGEHDHEAP